MNLTNENGEQLRKCSKCRCTLLIKYFKVNRKGDYTKTCDDCRAYSKKVRGEMRERNKERFKCEKPTKAFFT